jgi:hypothetical protein
MTEEERAMKDEKQLIGHSEQDHKLSWETPILKVFPIVGTADGGQNF